MTIKDAVQDKIRVRKLNSRQKGKAAEREVKDLLQPVVNEVFAERKMVPPKLGRNLMQFADGGHDISGAPGIAVEVKRCETLQLDAWWAQAQEQANRVKLLPVLIYRKSHMRWRVRMMGLLPVGNGSNVHTLVDIDCQDFLEWYRHYLHDLLDKNFSEKMF